MALNMYAASGLHTSYTFPVQRPEPGLHAPVHMLFRQMNGQGAGAYCPSELQVCSTSLPRHSVLPGTQAPEHAPVLQTYWHGVAASIHAPAVVQV